MASGNYCSNPTPKMSACRFYKDHAVVSLCLDYLKNILKAQLWSYYGLQSIFKIGNIVTATNFSWRLKVAVGLALLIK